jgi:hypothetical protein
MPPLMLYVCAEKEEQQKLVEAAPLSLRISKAAASTSFCCSSFCGLKLLLTHAALSYY